MKHQLVEVLRRLDNARSLMYYAGWAGADAPDEFPLAAVGVPAVGRQGARRRGAHPDLRPRRHRRDLGARRAAVLPPRAALAAAARRHGGRGRPRRRRAVRPGAGGGVGARLPAASTSLDEGEAPPAPRGRSCARRRRSRGGAGHCPRERQGHLPLLGRGLLGGEQEHRHVDRGDRAPPGHRLVDVAELGEHGGTVVG